MLWKSFATVLDGLIISLDATCRSFYIAIFEIYSERGKAEKLFDLLPDGGELSMQQSTVRGLKEVG